MSEHAREERGGVWIVERRGQRHKLDPFAPIAHSGGDIGNHSNLHVDSEWRELGLHGVGNLAASLVPCLHSHAQGEVSRANELARPYDVDVALTRCFASANGGR